MTIVKRFNGHDVPDGATHYKGGDFFILLDQEPLDFIRPIPIHRLKSWDGVGWSEGIMDAEVKFIELPQEPEKYLSVGEWCEYNNQNTGQWIKVFYLGRDSRGIHAIQYESNAIESYADCTFRPIKTEREKFDNWLSSKINNIELADEFLITQLYDIGALRIPEGN